MRALTGALLTCGALLAPACATLFTTLPGVPVAWATICTLTLWPTERSPNVQVTTPPLCAQLLLADRKLRALLSASVMMTLVAVAVPVLVTVIV